MATDENGVIADALTEPAQVRRRVALRLAPEPQPAIPEDTVILELDRVLADPGGLVNGMRFVLLKEADNCYRLVRDDRERAHVHRWESVFGRPETWKQCVECGQMIVPAEGYR